MSDRYAGKRQGIILLCLVFLLGMLGCVSAAAEDYAWLNDYLSADEEASEETGAEEPIALQTVTFGVWPQDDDPDTPPEPIEWYVLKNENNKKCLLLSVYALDSKPFQNNDHSPDWVSCYLRKWLRKTFYQNAFTAKEKKAIFKTKVKNSLKHNAPEWPRTTGGVDSWDSVFLLSYRECFKVYLQDVRLRICKPTAYALSQGVSIRNEELGSCYWWLRNAANHRYVRCIMLGDGGYESAGMRVDSIGVRPAMWVRYSSIADQLQPAE